MIKPRAKAGRVREAKDLPATQFRKLRPLGVYRLTGYGERTFKAWGRDEAIAILGPSRGYVIAPRSRLEAVGSTGLSLIKTLQQRGIELRNAGPRSSPGSRRDLVRKDGRLVAKGLTVAQAWRYVDTGEIPKGKRPQDKADANPRYQPRFAAYLRATGKKAGEVSNADYIAWVNRKVAAWRRASGTKGPMTPARNAAFQAWLDEGTSRASSSSSERLLQVRKHSRCRPGWKARRGTR